MSAPYFTQGPWRIEDDDCLGDVPFIPIEAGEYGPSFRKICEVYGNGVVETELEINDEDRANARLIAAAPDLYEALQAAVLQMEYLHDKFSETGTGNAVLARARAALAKARGEP